MKIMYKAFSSLNYYVNTTRYVFVTPAQLIEKSKIPCVVQRFHSQQS